jgi:hypothetical protein
VSKAPSNFRQLDVTRAIKAAHVAGMNVARVEIDPKTAIITIHGDGFLPLPVLISKKRRRKGGEYEKQ